MDRRRVCGDRRSLVLAVLPRPRGREAAAGGGCGASVSAAPDPDLKASVYFNQGCLRWSCFGRPLSPELYLYGGWRWEVAPEKSEASSAGHDGGDARGRRTLLVGAVQVASFPSSFHPARMPGESPNPCRIERQRRSGRRHPLGGVVRGELGVDVMLWLLDGGWWRGRSSSGGGALALCRLCAQPQSPSSTVLGLQQPCRTRRSGASSYSLMAAYLGGVAQWRFSVRCVAMDSRRRTKLSGVVVTSMAEWPDKVEASIFALKTDPVEDGGDDTRVRRTGFYPRPGMWLGWGFRLLMLGLGEWSG